MPSVWPIEVEKKEEGAPSYGLRHLVPALLIGGGIGGLLYWFEHHAMARIVWSISGFLFLCGLLTPRVFRKIERGLRIFAIWVGRILTVLLLVPFYYLVFFPGRLLFKLSGKDPMTRDCPTRQDTYWITCRKIEDPQVHFRRQF